MYEQVDAQTVIVHRTYRVGHMIAYKQTEYREGDILVWEVLYAEIVRFCPDKQHVMIRPVYPIEGRTRKVCMMNIY